MACFRSQTMDIEGLFFYHEFCAPLKLNAIYVSFMVSVCLLILFGQLKSKKILDWVIWFSLLVFLVLLSSKLILALTGIGLLFQGLKLDLNKRFIILPIAFILLSALLLLPIKQRFTDLISSDYEEVLTQEEFTPIYYWRGTTIRLVQARIGVEILNENKAWVQGVGFGASQPLIAKNQKEKNMYYGFGSYNFHNQYMQLLVEIGILGLLIYLVWLFKIGLDFKQDIMVISIILLIFGLGFTESFLWRQRGLLFFLAVMGTFYQFDLGKKINAQKQ